MEKLISDTLNFIQEQTGLILTPCDHFTGIHKHAGKDFFSVTLSAPIFAAKEYVILERFARDCKKIRVEPNGSHRLAIYPVGIP